MNSKTTPLISVVILNWNGYEDTILCVNSVLLSTYENREIIIVDNASTDGSVEKLRRVFPQLTLVVNGDNLGYAGGNNEGVRAARGDIIVILNNDTVVEPDFLTVGVRYMIEDSRIGLLAPSISYQHDRWITNYKVNMKTGGTSFGFIPIQRPQDSAFVSGCALFILRAVIEDIGLMDDSYFLYYEDVDYSIRAQKAGWRTVIVPDRTVHHQVSKSSGGGSGSVLKSYYTIRNRILFIHKNASRVQKLAFCLFYEPINWIAEMIGLFFKFPTRVLVKLFNIVVWVPTRPKMIYPFIKVMTKARLDAFRMLVKRKRE